MRLRPGAFETANSIPCQPKPVFVRIAGFAGHHGLASAFEPRSSRDTDAELSCWKVPAQRPAGASFDRAYCGRKGGLIRR